MTFLIASKPAPVGKIVSRGSTPSDFAKFLIVSSAEANGAAISSGPPREPGAGKSGSPGGRSSPLRTKSPRPCLYDINPALSNSGVPVAKSVTFFGAAGGK